MNENIVNSNYYSYLIVHIKCVDLILLNPPAAIHTYAFGINMPAGGHIFLSIVNIKIIIVTISIMF